MNGTIARLLFALAGATACLGACSKGQPPFRMVQICLAGPQEVPTFTSFMNAIAQDYEMEFTDRSGQTEAELRALGNERVPVAHPHVNIGADRAGDFSFGASNLGLPTEQIAIGFNGSDPEKARGFANAVVARLSAKWRVHEVPRGRGAMPLARCD